MALTLITPSIAEPVSLVEAKLYLRQDIDDDDTLIAGRIIAARRYCENTKNYSLMTQTWELVLDQWPGFQFVGPERVQETAERNPAYRQIIIPQPPLQQILFDNCFYYDTLGNPYAFDPTNYIVDTDRRPGRLGLAWGKVWPTVVLQPLNGIRIQFMAGYPSYSGTVNTDSTGLIVTNASGDLFNPVWSPLKSIIINDQASLISSVSTDGATLYLKPSTPAIPSQTGLPYLANDVPFEIIAAMMQLISHWYNTREPVLVERGEPQNIPKTVDDLLGFERVIPI
jgi:hypothetical protein